MLSLLKTPASRCLASRQGRNARPAVSSASLLQGQRRPLRPIAAVPGEPDKDFGLAPESGTGGSGLGRSQGTARPLSGADNAGIGSAPESGTRSDEGMPSSISSAGRSNEDSWGAQQAGQNVQSPTGKSSSSMTGQMPGGQHEVSAGWDVPSSDTHPEMDPAESKKYTERETHGSTSVPSGGSGSQSQEMRQQDSGSGHRHGRDESDAHMGGEDSGGSETRSHPVARTAATAIGSAAGTLLGAVGGPFGAAAGAALGGGVGRRIADALGGDEGQAEVYDQGAEPEQVAEELLGARDAVGERLESARDDIKERAHDATEAVQDKLHYASERTEDASRDAKHRTEDASHDAKQQMNKQQGRARDDDRSNYLQGSVGSRVQFAGEESGRPDTGGRTSSSGSGSGSREHGSGSHEHGSGSREHGSGSHEHGSGSHEHGKGLGGAIADAAKSTAHKLGSAADAVTGHAQFPEFPPAEGKAADGGTMRAADNLADAAKSAANKVASAGEGKASNHDTIGSGSSKGEGGASGGKRERGSEAAMPATASASAAGASDAGWDTADQKWDWGGLPNAEAAVKADVGAPSLMQQDGMGLAGVVESEEGLARRDSESGGALDAAAAGGQGMSGVVGGAGGYGGGASEFGEGMDQMRAQGSGMSGGAKPQTRSAPGGSSRVGVQAVDHGLPEGLLAAGGDDAQAAVGVGRDESAGATTSDSTAERVAQVFGLGPEASGGVEEANVYQKEAGQEGHKDGGASKAFEGASGRDIE